MATRQRFHLTRESLWNTDRSHVCESTGTIVVLRQTSSLALTDFGSGLCYCLLQQQTSGSTRTRRRGYYPHLGLVSVRNNAAAMRVQQNIKSFVLL